MAESVWIVMSPEAGVVRFSNTLTGALRTQGQLIRRNGQRRGDEYFVREFSRHELGTDEWSRVQKRIRTAGGYP